MLSVNRRLIKRKGNQRLIFWGFKGFFYGSKLVVGAEVSYGGGVVPVVTMAYGIAQFVFDIGNPAGFNGIAVLVFDIGHNLFVCRHRITLSTIKNKKKGDCRFLQVTVTFTLPGVKLVVPSAACRRRTFAAVKGHIIPWPSGAFPDF